MTTAMSIRPFYGGRFEPIWHLATIAVMYGSYFYITKDGPSEKDGIIALIMFGFSTLFWLPVINYRRVGMLHNIGEGTAKDLEGLRDSLAKDGYKIKGYTKMSIEAYLPRKTILPPDTHVVAFLHEGSIFTSAWRYAARGFEYVPFFLGTEYIKSIQETIRTNQALQTTSASTRRLSQS